MIKAVLIDFDGTLMNTRKGIVDSWKFIFKKVKNMEVDEEYLAGTFGEPLKDSLKRLFPELELEEALGIYKGYQKEHHKEMMVLFDGMKETMKKLKILGYKIALVTSRGSASSIEGLKENDIYEYFDELITADKCDKHKPDKEPIMKALENLGVKNSEAVMIGDTMFDLQSAKAADVKSILVGWTCDVDKYNVDEEFKPNAICEKADDIIEIIEEM